KSGLDLRDQRADQPRRIVPVRPSAANEVMRHSLAGLLATRQPRREQRALAHTWPAGHHHPSIGWFDEQEPIELDQHPIASDEAPMPLPLDRKVDRRGRHAFAAPTVSAWHRRRCDEAGSDRQQGSQSPLSVTPRRFDYAVLASAAPEAPRLTTPF